MRPTPALVPLLFWTFGLSVGGVGEAAEPPNAGQKAAQVAKALDREIQKRLDSNNVKASPLADDATFLRRVTLDITGRIPTAEQAEKFLASSEATRRAQLIDALLADARYGEYHASAWQAFIEATGDPPNSMRSKFEAWLAAELNQGRGWDKIVHTMLTEGEGPAGYFVWANYKEPGELASTTARFFLGVQIQCAQCHDHPFADWQQSDYWGLAAFYSRVKRLRVKGKGNVLTEDAIPGKKKKKPIAQGAFITIPESGTRTGAGKVVHAKFLKASTPKLPDEGAVRQHLAAWITAKENPYFAKAIVNRTWAHFFGKGLVPLTEGLGTETEPSHPEVLDLLTRELIDSGFDLKHLIRCIVSSETYQRSSQTIPENQKDGTLYSHASVRVLPPDVLFDSVVAAMGNPKLRGGLASPLPYEIYSGRKRSSNVSTREAFIDFFGRKDDGDKSTDYTYGIPQALALMNAEQFNAVPPIAEKLVKAKASEKKAIETLFLATLTRLPTDRESSLMSNYLAGQKNAQAGYQGILWILLNTSEFTLNQ